MFIQGSDLITTVDQLSYACGIDVLSGTVRQSYDKTQHEFNPSRANAIPLVLLPWIGSFDAFNGDPDYAVKIKPSQVQYILRRIVGNTWTETNLNATSVVGYKIAAPSNKEDYVTVSIGSGLTSAVQTFPAWSLIVEEDVPGSESREIEAHIFCIDPQTGGTVERVSTIILSTNTTEGHSYKLEALSTIPGDRVIDPLRATLDADGKRSDTLAVQLYADNVAVPDENAIYWWYFWENGNPVLIKDDNQLFVLDGLNADGTFKKELKINSDYFNRLVLMCRACYYDGFSTKPTAPSDEDAHLKVVFNRSRRYSRHINGKVEAIKGIKIRPEVEVERRIQLTDKVGDLTNEEMAEHFDVNWKSRTSTGNVKIAGTGLIVGNVASEYGVTDKVSSAILPTVMLRRAYKPLKSSSKIVTSGMLALDGKILMFQNLKKA